MPKYATKTIQILSYTPQKDRRRSTCDIEVTDHNQIKTITTFNKQNMIGQGKDGKTFIYTSSNPQLSQIAIKELTLGINQKFTFSPLTSFDKHAFEKIVSANYTEWKSSVVTAKQNSCENENNINKLFYQFSAAYTLPEKFESNYEIYLGPNCNALYNVTSGPRYFIAMPFFTGTPLRNIQFASINDFINTLLAIAEQVALIHSKKHIHADLHSNNILIDKKFDGINVQIIDYGRSVEVGETLILPDCRLPEECRNKRMTKAYLGYDIFFLSNLFRELWTNRIVNTLLNGTRFYKEFVALMSSMHAEENKRVTIGEIITALKSIKNVYQQESNKAYFDLIQACKNQISLANKNITNINSEKELDQWCFAYYYFNLSLRNEVHALSYRKMQQYTTSLNLVGWEEDIQGGKLLANNITPGELEAIALEIAELYKVNIQKLGSSITSTLTPKNLLLHLHKCDPGLLARIQLTPEQVESFEILESDYNLLYLQSITHSLTKPIDVLPESKEEPFTQIISLYKENPSEIAKHENEFANLIINHRDLVLYNKLLSDSKVRLKVESLINEIVSPDFTLANSSVITERLKTILKEGLLKNFLDKISDNQKELVINRIYQLIPNYFTTGHFATQAQEMGIDNLAYINKFKRLADQNLLYRNTGIYNANSLQQFIDKFDIQTTANFISTLPKHFINEMGNYNLTKQQSIIKIFSAVEKTGLSDHINTMASKLSHEIISSSVSFKNGIDKINEYKLLNKTLHQKLLISAIDTYMTRRKACGLDYYSIFGIYSKESKLKAAAHLKTMLTVDQPLILSGALNQGELGYLARNLANSR